MIQSKKISEILSPVGHNVSNFVLTWNSGSIQIISQSRL